MPFNTLPILLGSLADSFSFVPSQIGVLGSVCFTGYVLGTLVTVGFIDRCNWPLLTFGCDTRLAKGTTGFLICSA